MTSIKLCLAGADGRMGRSIIEEGKKWPQIEIVGAVTRRDSPNKGKTLREISSISSDVRLCEPHSLEEALRDADIYLSFTTPDAEASNLPKVAQFDRKIVVGTTGFTMDQEHRIEESIKNTVPAVISPNFAIGVNIFLKILYQTKAFPETYDFSVVEAHHTGKKDAPSGTAKKICKILSEERGYRKLIYGREGISNRKKGELEMSSLRIGGVPGIHEVLIAGPYEMIRLEHTAFSRQVFCHGALLAVTWIHNQRIPGIYSMGDVLGFK